MVQNLFLVLPRFSRCLQHRNNPQHQYAHRDTYHLSLFANMLRSQKTYYSIGRANPGRLSIDPAPLPTRPHIPTPGGEGVFKTPVTIHPSLPSRILPSIVDGRCIWDLSTVTGHPSGSEPPPQIRPLGTNICVLPGRMNTFNGRHTSQLPRSSNDSVANAFWERRGVFAGSVLTGGRGPLLVVGSLLFSVLMRRWFIRGPCGAFAFGWRRKFELIPLPLISFSTLSPPPRIPR